MQIVEALLDLTGAPCYTIDFGDASFNMARLWAQLVHYAKQGFPMGCATDRDEELKGSGIVGGLSSSPCLARPQLPRRSDRA